MGFNFYWFRDILIGGNKVIGSIEKELCKTCRFLLHYEWDKDKKAHCLPRCSIEFRNGSQVKDPCPDYLKKEN